jgi:glucose-1-phosphate thymidylyltransferase
MKVIIPAGGYGTRMRPHTHTRPKPLVPVAGRPSLAFILDALKPLPVEEVIFITGKMGEQMEEYVSKHYDFKTRFIEQKVMRGQADAISLAEDYLEGDLLSIFVDTLFEADLELTQRIPDADGIAYVAEVPDPSRFGIAVLGPDGYVTRLVEKPQNPESNLAVAGLYYFKDAKWLVRAIHTLMDSGRSLKGEYYLVDAIQVMLDEGAKLRTSTVSVWEDTGTPDAVLHANRYLLRKTDEHKEPYLHGTSLIVPPSYISPEAKAEHSIIGPYASVSEGANIRDSIVKNSIVSANAKITGAMLFGAIVGERATVEGSYQTVNLGDDSATHIIGASQAEIDETFK